MCRTRPKPGPDPVWDEEFSLDDVPSDVIMFTITVYNHGKRSKDSEVCVCVCVGAGVKIRFMRERERESVKYI